MTIGLWGSTSPANAMLIEISSSIVVLGRAISFVPHADSAMKHASSAVRFTSLIYVFTRGLEMPFSFGSVFPQWCKQQ